MAKEVDYQDDDVVVISRNPLQGRLLLITEDDEGVELHLDKDSAEALMSALGAFLMERRDRSPIGGRQNGDMMRTSQAVPTDLKLKRVQTWTDHENDFVAIDRRMKGGTVGRIYTFDEGPNKRKWSGH